MGSIYFYLISGIAAVFGTAFIISVREIYYHSPDTDNELMAYAAAQSDKWRWPSDVYTYCISKTKVAMKEWTIILLSIFQRISGDKKTDWSYTAMTGLAVSACSVLIYLIAANYFNPTTGLIVAIFYIISFWPWQIALYGGHANIGNLFFLLSIYSIRLSSSEVALPYFILIMASGALFCFSVFSSPSSRKYLIPVFAALFFREYYDLFTSHDILGIVDSIPANRLLFMDGIIIAVFFFIYITILSAYKSAVRKIYFQQAPVFLNKLMPGRDQFTLEHYLDYAPQKIKIIMRRLWWILFPLLILINLIPASIFIMFLTGFVLIYLLTTLPYNKKIARVHLAHLIAKKTHFRSHISDFAKIGISVHRTTRGAGLSWVPKIFWTFAPFHIILFMVALAVGEYQSLSAGNITESFLLIVVAIIAFSPIIWAELTNAPQVPRTYSLGIITGLLLPAYVISGIMWTPYTLIIFCSLGILAFVWNFWKFTNDVYPSRMTLHNLMRTVRRFGIIDIYTYKTVLNGQFIDAIPGIGKSEYMPKRDIVPPFRIHYIRRLDEVKDGWIVIPGINRMAMTLKGLVNDDYANDPIRQRLIETKQIEKIAVAKLKTFGTSAIWANEDEVASYCAQFLKHLIKTGDLYNGYAWILHSSKLPRTLDFKPL